MDEVDVDRGRRPSGLQVHVGDRAPLPHRVLAPVGERGRSSATSRRATDAHPPRLRHLQRHAAGEPPGARRRAGRDARPPLATAASSSAWAAARRRPSRRASASTTPSSRARCSTRSCREFRKMWRRRGVPASTAGSSRCRRATCCRSRTRDPHPPMWVAAGNPVDVREGGAHGPRRAVLHDRRTRGR